MKILGICLAVFAAQTLKAETFLSQSYCKAAVEAAEDNRKAAEDQFAVGEATLTTVVEAQVAEWNQKFMCRATVFDEYCANIVDLSSSLIEMLEEEVSVGLRLPKDVQEAKLKDAKYNAMCDE